MYILPLPPCGFSIRAQNGYGHHRPCKIVLLTLVTPKGVTDLYLSWGINIEHARTAYQKLVELIINNFIVDVIHNLLTNTVFQLEHSTSTPNERVWRITQLAKLSFNHPSVVLTADVFQFVIKSTSPWSRPHEVAQVTRNFSGVTTATYSYVIPVANLRLLGGEANL